MPIVNFKIERKTELHSKSLFEYNNTLLLFKSFIDSIIYLFFYICRSNLLK